MSTPPVTSINDDLIAELEAAAKAATPGPWVTDGEYINEHGNLLYCHVGVPGDGRLADTSSNCMVPDQECRSNAWFIATANPATILALLAERAELKRDADRLNKLDSIGYAYGFEDMHEGNRWMIDGPYRDIRTAIDDMQETKP